MPAKVRDAILVTAYCPYQFSAICVPEFQIVASLRRVILIVSMRGQLVRIWLPRGSPSGKITAGYSGDSGIRARILNKHFAPALRHGARAIRAGQDREEIRSLSCGGFTGEWIHLPDFT